MSVVQSPPEVRQRSALTLWSASPLRSSSQRTLFVVFLISLCVLRYVFRFPQSVYTHDSFVFLDGAWRILNGQRPQIDFSTNIGPLTYLATAAGIAITHQGGHALAMGQALLGLVVAVPAAYLTSRRMAQVPGMMLATLLVLLALAPFNTGESPYLLTFAMIYNRVGYALLGVVLVEATQAGRTGRDEFIGGLFPVFFAGCCSASRSLTSAWLAGWWFVFCRIAGNGASVLLDSRPDRSRY